MKTIFTTFHPATDKRGSRLKATNGDHSIYIPYPHELGVEAAHLDAALTLCRKFNWSGVLVRGDHPKGCVFMWLEEGECFGVPGGLPVNCQVVPRDNSLRRHYYEAAPELGAGNVMQKGDVLHKLDGTTHIIGDEPTPALPLAKHPTPEGYRRLGVGEVVQAGDIENACYNHGAFDRVGYNGFLDADELGDVGEILSADALNAYYRPTTLPAVLPHNQH